MFDKKEYMAKYRQKNKEALAKYMRDWRLKNSEKTRETRRVYYLSHKKQSKERYRLWRLEHLEVARKKKREYMRIYCKSEKGLEAQKRAWAKKHPTSKWEDRRRRGGIKSTRLWLDKLFKLPKAKGRHRLLFDATMQIDGITFAKNENYDKHMDEAGMIYAKVERLWNGRICQTEANRMLMKKYHDAIKKASRYLRIKTVKPLEALRRLSDVV